MHNYLKKMSKHHTDGTLKPHVGLGIANVAHDSWCAIYGGKECNCNPDITYIQPMDKKN